METGQSLELDAGDGYLNYLWNTGDTTRRININQLGTYSVNVNSATVCEVADTVFVTNCDIPDFNPFSDTTSVCGTSFVLNAGNAYSNYLWNNSATTNNITALTSGWYRVTVTNENGC
ncbi:MAG: hypothetical protein RIR36_380, partial [Bacteroidota bacterium]